MSAKLVDICRSCGVADDDRDEVSIYLGLARSDQGSELLIHWERSCASYESARIGLILLDDVAVFERLLETRATRRFYAMALAGSRDQKNARLVLIEHANHENPAIRRAAQDALLKMVEWSKRES